MLESSVALGRTRGDQVPHTIRGNCDFPMPFSRRTGNLFPPHVFSSRRSAFQIGRWKRMPSTAVNSCHLDSLRVGLVSKRACLRNGWFLHVSNPKKGRKGSLKHGHFPNQVAQLTDRQIQWPSSLRLESARLQVRKKKAVAAEAAWAEDVLGISPVKLSGKPSETEMSHMHTRQAFPQCRSHLNCTTNYPRCIVMYHSQSRLHSSRAPAKPTNSS